MIKWILEFKHKFSMNIEEVGEKVYRSADLINILARILDSERNFNGSADPMITADRGFIQFWGSDLGFWLLGSSSLLFFLVSARFCFDTDIGYISILLIVILNAKTQYHARKLQQLKSLCISRII